MAHDLGRTGIERHMILSMEIKEIVRFHIAHRLLLLVSGVGCWLLRRGRGCLESNTQTKLYGSATEQDPAPRAWKMRSRVGSNAFIDHL